MKTKLFFKVLLLTVFTVLTFNQSFSQNFSCADYKTNRDSLLNQMGIERSIKVVDQNNNEFLPSDLYYGDGYGSTRSGCGLNNTCVAGLFTLHFQDAIASNSFGFDDCNPSGGTTVGQLRQDVACQVFRDLSNLLFDVSNGANNGRVHIWMLSDQTYSSNIATWPGNNVGALNSTLYVLPAGLNNVMLDSEIWKTIRGGQNSYLNLPPQFNPPNSNAGMYHGLIAVNFGGASAWNLNLDVATPNNSTDLYTVILHEAIHGLGFASEIFSNGSSKLGGDLYSRYDTYLHPHL